MSPGTTHIVEALTPEGVSVDYIYQVGSSAALQPSQVTRSTKTDQVSVDKYSQEPTSEPTTIQ
jgi:hypothetical protein